MLLSCFEQHLRYTVLGSKLPLLKVLQFTTQEEANLQPVILSVYWSECGLWGLKGGVVLEWACKILVKAMSFYKWHMNQRSKSKKVNSALSKRFIIPLLCTSTMVVIVFLPSIGATLSPPPVIRTGPFDQTLMEGATAVFYCHLVGDEGEVQWTKGEEPIPGTSR